MAENIMAFLYHAGNIDGIDMDGISTKPDAEIESAQPTLLICNFCKEYVKSLT